MDYLKRGELLAFLDEICQKATCDAYVSADCIRDRVRIMPAANVAPVCHGRWILDGNKEWHCSECNYYCEDIHFSDTPGYVYCPQCGVKMDLERPGED